jgi:hypothetical protein
MSFFLNATINQYVFCGNNPVNVRDPSGLCKKKYTVLDGAKYLEEHTRNVVEEGFWGNWRLPILSGGYFGEVDKKEVYANNPNVFYSLDGVLYTPSEIGNIAVGRTAYMRGSQGEFAAAKYGGEVLFADYSGFKMSNLKEWGSVYVWAAAGVSQMIEGAKGSFGMNNLGAQRGGRSGYDPGALFNPVIFFDF